MNAEPKLPPQAAVEDTATQALAEAMRTSFVVVRLLLIGLAVYFLCSGVFIVKEQERAVILRFGKPVGTGLEALRGPGFHWAFPYPIDEVYRIKAVKVQSAASTIGWYAEDARRKAAGQETPVNPTLDPIRDGYLLTGDRNIIHVRAILRYSIEEPLEFFFNHSNAYFAVTNALDNAVVFAASRYNVDDALRRDLAGLQDLIRRRVEATTARMNLGIKVQQVDLVTAPPRQVQDAFEEVIKAENKRGEDISVAQGYAAEVRSRAEGEAAARINAAQAAAVRFIESIKSDARYFSELLPRYQANPTLFSEWLQTEVLARALTNSQEKFFLPIRTGPGQRELRLQLSREPQKLKTTLTPPKTEGHQH